MKSCITLNVNFIYLQLTDDTIDPSEELVLPLSMLADLNDIELEELPPP